MAEAPHILEQVMALAKGHDDFELFKGKGGQPVRLSNDAANLWIMRASEDGSIYDRWSNESRMQFVRLTETEIEQGPAALWEQLRALADENISHREDTQ